VDSNSVTDEPLLEPDYPYGAPQGDDLRPLEAHGWYSNAWRIKDEHINMQQRGSMPDHPRPNNEGYSTELASELGISYSDMMVRSPGFDQQERRD
jgi:hypothetical protein